VGIGSRDKALRRALNVALALSVVRQLPFAPEVGQVDSESLTPVASKRSKNFKLSLLL
jgi:hypothetical protein